MSEWDRYQKAAWDIALPQDEKLLLLALAKHACAHCGLTWPGLPALQKLTGMGLNKLRAALARLVARQDGTLRVHSYGRGGRACSTVYGMLEGVLVAEGAPCPKCVANLARPGRAGFARKPAAAADTTPPPGGYPPPLPSPRPVGIGPQTHLPTPAAARVQGSPARAVAGFTAAVVNTHLPGGYQATAQPREGTAFTGTPGARRTEQPSVEQEPSGGWRPERRSERASPADSSTTASRSVGDVLREMFPGTAWRAQLDDIPAPATASEKGKAQTPYQQLALAAAAGGPS